MWASHFVRNGNKLSISSWLTTEVQVCRNVCRPNPGLLNLVINLCFYELTKLSEKIGIFALNDILKKISYTGLGDKH